MENNLYSFIDQAGSFTSLSADKIKSLYLPLCNETLMSAITADLHGDIKAGQNAFLMEPASRIDLSLSRGSRNFWVYINPDKIWSAAGVSKDLNQLQSDEFTLEAGQLYQRLSRKNNSLGLASEILSFVPAGRDALELMQVKITNISKDKISFIPYTAIPLYARSADNLRDHRHVTSLLNRIEEEKYGIKVKPTLLFDESGHRPNSAIYYVAACDQRGRHAQYIYSTQEDFCGDSGDLEAPESVFKNRLPCTASKQGKEPMGAMRFSRVTLAAGRAVTYTIIMGISQNDCDLSRLLNKFNSPKKIDVCFTATKKFWQGQSSSVVLESANKHFDNWLRWVSIQPVLRKIYGCSFLPDFDYGKGGRGWRDLWQDCLGLILNNPKGVRALLINNFCGVKIDGSNATIIGKNPGEFVADRNNISRVWMDHGVWPLLTLDLYIQETGDFKILTAPATYFRNHQLNRAQDIDYRWSPAYGVRLKTKSGQDYSGTVLEHLLVQNLVQFYNVGAHNHVRLEGADWNDGLDMAKEHGESVAFSAMYAKNLLTLSQLLLNSRIKYLEVAQELKILLVDFNYANIACKQRMLKKYFTATQECLSGNKVRLNAADLSRSLAEKSFWMSRHIQKKEWLKEGFFNGYYDNRKRRVDGKQGNLTRMILASQVFPIMGQVATCAQTEMILAAVQRYLYDRSIGGIHLNTDFKQQQHNLGRAFSFAYGDKENGAVFSHMVVMFAYALYKQGYSKAAWQALNSLYKMAANTQKSKIYPGLPEYFDLEGRGMYSYLTGSASWFMFTLLTQSFGIRGQCGDLLIEPKLTSEQFKTAGKISISRNFAQRRIKATFFNPRCLESGKYRIKRVLLNSAPIPVIRNTSVAISRQVITRLPKNKLNIIAVHLG
jgi:cellobiose phosphorylase